LFQSDLHLFVAELARRRVFLHAGVVGWCGRAILIPGRSFSGKTTLVTELIRVGATYYSDEYAVLDASGRVHPYPRPLAIREDKSGRPTRYPVEALGGVAGIKPLPVGLVLVSQYRPGARWRPRPLSPGQGALALLENAVSIRRQPEVVLPTLQRVVAGSRIVKSARGEARHMAEEVLEDLW
jgi:hypothetical protein